MSDEPERGCIDVSIVRSPDSHHVELIFKCDFPLGSEAFYVALRAFVEGWSENPKALFKYHDQFFHHTEH